MRYFISIIILLLLGCSHRSAEAELFRLNYTDRWDLSEPNWYEEHIFVVVSNPPRTQVGREKMAIDYVKYVLGLPDVKRFRSEVVFLKETNFSPRTLVPDEEHDAISSHVVEDEIITFEAESRCPKPFWRYCYPDDRFHTSCPQYMIVNGVKKRIRAGCTNLLIRSQFKVRHVECLQHKALSDVTKKGEVR